jgi:hypothetical protein
MIRWSKHETGARSVLTKFLVSAHASLLQCSQLYDPGTCSFVFGVDWKNDIDP